MNPKLKAALRPLVRPLRALMRQAGYDIAPYTVPEASADPRIYWIQALGVDHLIDVGANAGQYVGWMRERGYAGPILSFEPQRKAFDACVRRWGSDPRWQGIRAALGDSPGELVLHVAGNSYSSSLLPMLEAHVEALPESAIVGEERVPVRRLDEAAADAVADARAIWLKVDTQGYELPVLRGAGRLLERVVAIELELSLVPLYAGQELLPEVWAAVEHMGFEPVWLEQGFADLRARRILQVDAIFKRRGTR